MRRAHSSRNWVRFCRRCATSSRNSAAVDSVCAWGSDSGDCASFPLVAMAGAPRLVECCCGATARLVPTCWIGSTTVTDDAEQRYKIYSLYEESVSATLRGARVRLD